MNRLRQFWDNLQPRERVMLGTMLIVFAVLGLFVVSVVIKSSFDKTRQEIESYREALTLIEDNRDAYIQDKVEKDKLKEELLNNDLKVSNFLFVKASELGFDVNVNPKDPHRLEDDPSIEEQEIEITIKTVERDALLQYLWSISHSKAPIYIRRLDIRRTRGGSGTTAADTPLSASLSIVSYRLKLEE